MDAVY